MKTEQEVRKMLRSIRKHQDQVDSEYATAQLLMLLWILDELPNASKKFHDLVAEGKMDEAERLGSYFEQYDADLIVAAVNNA